jgi:hypothetical protein
MIEELLERTVAAPVYKTEINGRGDSLRWPRDTLYPQKLTLTSPTSGGRSVGIVRLRIKATEFSFITDIVGPTLNTLLSRRRGCDYLDGVWIGFIALIHSDRSYTELQRYFRYAHITFHHYMYTH